MSDPVAVDPEEALVAAVSSCDMPWFLDPARAAGFMLSSCTDGKLLSIVSRKRMHEVIDEDFFGRVGKVAAQTFDCEKHVFGIPRQRC
ncbi:MAG: hypothetical protein AAFV27_12535, partial [Pseudomonadota bacterium]